MSNRRKSRAYGLLAPPSDVRPRRAGALWLRIAVLSILSIPIIAEAIDSDPVNDAGIAEAATDVTTDGSNRSDIVAAVAPRFDEPAARAAVPVELVAVSEPVAKGYAEVAFIPEATTTTTTEPPAAEASATTETTAAPLLESSPPPTAAPSPPSTVVAPATDGPGEALGRFTVTCYSLRGNTASGAPVAEDGIAVDRSVIPLGSRVYVDGLGWKVARDTGSAVRGHAIDIWNPSSGYCASWGRQTREVWLG